jgi:ketosteroid isomerase-like protein
MSRGSPELVSETDNRAVIEDYYVAMSEGNFPRVVELHSPELVCWMSGTSIVSGRFKGRDALYAHMGEHVLGPLVVGTEPYVKESSIAIVDASIVVGLLHGGLPSKDGGRYDQYYLQIFRLEDGLIAEIVELFDTVMVETVLMKHQLKLPRNPPARPFDFAANPRVSRGTRDEVVTVTDMWLEALTNRDRVQLRAVVHPSVRIRTIGSTPLSGLSEGVDALVAAVDRGVQDARLVCADSASACVLMRCSDSAYHQQYGILLRVREKQIIDISIFLDTVEVERTLFTNPILPHPSTSVMPPFDIAQAQLASASALR